MKDIFFITLFLGCYHLTIGQVRADSTSLFLIEEKLPANFREKIRLQKWYLGQIFGDDSSKTKNYPAKFILKKIDTDPDYNFLFIAEYWIAYHYNEIIPELIKRLTNKKYVGLTNSFDLIIWDRINNRQMKFYGHGELSFDDMFTVAGRASRLLSVITGEDSVHVFMNSSKKELQWVQDHWISWLKRIKEDNSK